MRKRTFVTLMCFLFAVVFLLSALLSIRYSGNAPMRLLAVNWNEDTGSIYRDLPYEDGLHYDLYIPAGLKQSEPQHLLLYIHGGSFNSGTKEDGDVWCKYFASQGCIAATLDYSLQKKGRFATLQQMNHEIASCVSSINRYCSELGYVLDGMAPIGVSAGGTLAMNYAYTSAETSAIPIRFVCQLAAPTDFEPADWPLLMQINGIKTPEEFIRAMSESSTADDISPARLVTHTSVPTLMAYGLRDHIIPANQREKLLLALQENNIVYEYHALPNSNHGLYGDLDLLEIFMNRLMVWSDMYFHAEY